MDRRDFLKKAGLVAVASAPLLAGLPKRAKADGGAIEFIFACLSYSTANPTGEATTLNGAGAFSAEDGEVTGGGCYNFINTGASGLPKPLLENGEWRANTLISWSPNGTYGSFASGILELGVTLFPAGGSPYHATLEVVCNIPFVPLLTGEPEGFKLTTPTVTFAPGAVVGQSQVGVTLLCVGEDD
jgi:hypothetical protein